MHLREDHAKQIFIDYNLPLADENIQSALEPKFSLKALIDSAKRRMVIIAANSENTFNMTIDPLLGVMPYQGRELGYYFDLNHQQVKDLVTILIDVGKLFVAQDLSFLQTSIGINNDGSLICIDAMLSVDDNALYRQSGLQTMYDYSQTNELTIKAKSFGLSYSSLDGDIGCLVNGAGLAMATMDLIKIYGGMPANFLDIGGIASKEKVLEAFKIIIADTRVKAILVNIFGGIVRCDVIASGIIEAIVQLSINFPVIVRLEGNNAQEGIKIINNSDLHIIVLQSWQDAVEQVVKSVGDSK